MDRRILQQRSIWNKKTVLQEVYHNYYQRIVNVCCEGLTLELGGGSGNLKEYMPEIISIDILCTPWLDVVADAQSLPFAASSFQNIVMLDVLHHLQSPRLFFTEAFRVLKPKGRLVLLEPGITPISWFFYSIFHHEQVDLSEDPLMNITINHNRDPFESNQAIPTILFGRYKNKFSETFPKFGLLEKKWLSLFVYPLSGGFKKWHLIPYVFVKPLLSFEDKISSLLGPIMGFRMFIVLEKL